MVYDVLDRIRRKGLKNCIITISDKNSGKGHIYGRDIMGINRSLISFKGGETGYEEFIIPLEKVLEIRVNGKVEWRKKKSIKRIYPRK